jgi:hypothetical protein
MKTHWRSLSDQPHLGSWDLEEDGKFKTVIVTIDRIYSGELANQAGKQKKTFVKFKEFSKSMVCNTTNFKRLEKRFRTFDFNHFVGQTVILQVEKVDSPQGQVDALRFSAKAPPAQNQAPQKKTVTDERLADAIESINSNKMTKDQFLSLYELTADQQKKLDESCS